MDEETLFREFFDDKVWDRMIQCRLVHDSCGIDPGIDTSGIGIGIGIGR